MSAKRGGRHRSKPAAIDDALPEAMSVELVSWDDMDALYGQYMLHLLATNEAHADDPAVIRAHEAADRELAKGIAKGAHETAEDRAYVARVRNQLRTSLAMTLELYRLLTKPNMYRAQALDAVASGFGCDPRSVRSACDEWLCDSPKFQEVLAQYCTAVQERLAQSSR